jgi:hypothetical protein
MDEDDSGLGRGHLKAMSIRGGENKYVFLLYRPIYSLTRMSDSTAAQVTKELAQEEVDEAKRGDIQLHEITPASFLRTGFELEEQQ